MLCKILILPYLFDLVAVAVAYASDDDYVDLYGFDYYDQIQCGQYFCNRTTQECKFGISCECRPEFEYNPVDGHCHICPGEGNYCTHCCFGGAVCYAGRCQHCWKDQNGECISQDSLFFLTAAQVALATAMVIGVAALATLLYKTFRSRSRNNNQQILENEIQRSSLNRASLTSMQIRVLRRLRDRPPKYETRHNYEYHQRERTQTTQQRHNTSPVSRQSRDTQSTGDPPPAYDGDVLSVVDLPPPYSAEPPSPESRISIIGDHETAEDATSNGSVLPRYGCGTGVVNGAFDNVEGCAVRDKNVDISIVKCAEHKIIHI